MFVGNKMTITNLYAMTDNAIAETVGQRIENIRLAANKSQQQISDEVGITRSTYRKLILGQAKLQTIIAVLRALNELPLVDDFIPDIEESRLLILKVMEQAIRDYVSLQIDRSLNERVAWETARDFLFDDEYKLMWGDMEISTEALLDIIDLDISWVRSQSTKKFKEARRKK